MTRVPSELIPNGLPFVGRGEALGRLMRTALVAAGCLLLACPACCKSSSTDDTSTENGETSAEEVEAFKAFLLACVDGKVKPTKTREVKSDEKVDHIMETFAFDKEYVLGDLIAGKARSAKGEPDTFTYRHLPDDRKAGCIHNVYLQKKYKEPYKKVTVDDPLGPFLGTNKETGRDGKTVYFQILDGPFKDWVVERGLPEKLHGVVGGESLHWVDLRLVRPGMWADTNLYKTWCGGRRMREATLKH